jgi:hypothetical protein
VQLVELVSGPLQSHISLRENLHSWPDELYRHAETLEVLDLSDNSLSALPDDFHRFQQLKRLFLTNNQFREIPAILAGCPNLRMVSFKGNQLERFAPAVFADSLEWLILTDNQLTELPDDFGRYHQLKKLALAGNRLSRLPESMQQCQQLGLIRLSLNCFAEFPDWLFRLPKLAWLALGANPATPVAPAKNDIPVQKLADYQLQQQIGIGASGVIYQALSPSAQLVAVKMFKGWVTSDGCPRDELANYLNAGNHQNLIPILASFADEQAPGLVMALIPKTFSSLGYPPSLDSITRDTFAKTLIFQRAQVLLMARQVASVVAHLQHKGIAHGDLYAHNMLINANQQLLLGDFGAATALSALPEPQQLAFKAIEVRAFGYWLADICALMPEESADFIALYQQCLQDDITKRPDIDSIYRKLQAMA